MNAEFEIWQLLAGIGIFLFGMHIMEESIRLLSGQALKQFIRKYTDTKLKAIASGSLSTAVLQSSSAVTLMVLAFVGAGIMHMNNAIGVILGSNLGTTLTSWIVASIGFKVKIEVLALPFVGIGGLSLIFFGSSPKRANIAKLMVGFGFLFMGLDYMKSSIDDFASSFDLSLLPDYGSLFYLLIGFLITAIVQSSSAAMAIILTAVFSGVIDFTTATAMVIGTNMGTTITVMLGSMGGSFLKKRVALSHFIFNLFTGIIALLLLHPISYLIQEIINLKNDPVIGIALFHTLFNLTGVVVFSPFIHLLTKAVTRLIADQQKSSLFYLDKNSISVAEAAISALFDEIHFLIKRVIHHNLIAFGIDTKLVLSAVPLPNDGTHRFSDKNPSRIYNEIKSSQAAVFSYAAELQENELEKAEATLINRYLHAVRYAVAAAKTIKDIIHNLEDIESSEDQVLISEHEDFRKKVLGFFSQLSNILDANNDEKEVVKMYKLWEKVIQSDRQLIQKITTLSAQKKVSGENISLLLTINRQVLTMERQLLTALKDLLLTEEEAGIYEHLETTLS